ncbi:MAG: fatty acid desaturase family protein [Burkholderiaceae bacterium]
MTETIQTGNGSEFRDDTRRRHHLPPDVLRELTAMNDALAWRSIALNLGVIAVLLSTGLILWETWWWLLPALALPIALSQQALFVLAHDAAHYRLFRSRALNDRVGRMLATVVGISMCSYRIVHRLHHNDLYGPSDPDIPLHGGYPRGRAYLAKKLLRDLAGLTAHKTYGYFFGSPSVIGGDGVRLTPLDDTAPTLRAAARRDRWLVVAFHIAAPLCAWAAGYLPQYLILWVLPLITVLQAVLRFRAILEHGAVSDISSPLTAARTNLGPRWLIRALFPHCVNYHVEHHLYPAIPHYNLPACHAALRDKGWLENAEVSDVFDTARKVIGPTIREAF